MGTASFGPGIHLKPYVNPARHPDKQAFDWSERQSPAGHHAWVLGCGDGKHVQALQCRFPTLSITVIDHDPHLQAPHFSEGTELLRIEGEFQLLSSDAFFKNGRSISQILEFMPYTHSRPEFYKQMHAILRGQTANAFLWLAEEIGAAFDAEAIKMQNEINIKTVFPHLRDTNPPEILQRFSLLRDLVA